MAELTQVNLRRYIALCDALAVVVALAVSYVSRFGDTQVQPKADMVGLARFALSAQFQAAVILVLWLILLAVLRTRDHRITGSGQKEYRRVIRAGLLVLVYLSVVGFLFKLDLPRLFIGYSIVIGVVLTVLNRWLWRQCIQHRRRRGELTQRVALIGPYQRIRAIAKNMLEMPCEGYVPVALLPDQPMDQKATTILGVSIPVEAEPSNLLVPLRAHAAQAVFVVGSARVDEDLVRRISWRLEGSGIDLILSSNLLNVSSTRVTTKQVAGLTAMVVDIPRFEGPRYLAKRLVDLTIATVGVVITSPIMLIAIALVWLEDRGPVFYRQQRVGLRGIPFYMLKIRTMRVGADAQHQTIEGSNQSPNAVMFKVENDPRITRIGRLLRRTSIDELPQFFNVLAGQMSVVGPRPPLPSEVEHYEAIAHRRLLVMPGITGLWQVSGRNSLTWDDTVRIDLDYVENWSVVGDLLIVAKTFAAVIRGSGVAKRDNG